MLPSFHHIRHSPIPTLRGFVFGNSALSPGCSLPSDSPLHTAAFRNNDPRGLALSAVLIDPSLDQQQQPSLGAAGRCKSRSMRDGLNLPPLDRLDKPSIPSKTIVVYEDEGRLLHRITEEDTQYTIGEQTSMKPSPCWTQLGVLKMAIKRLHFLVSQTEPKRFKDGHSVWLAGHVGLTRSDRSDGVRSHPRLPLA